MTKQTLLPSEPNMLGDLHEMLIKLAADFRDQICVECNWSVPTYYRKMRITTIKTQLSEKLQNPLSNAEKDMIVTIFDALLTEVSEYAQKYRK